MYDNARGKINTAVLTKLVHKHSADELSPTGQRHGNLARWNEVVKEYNAATGQGKTRALLMKRWTALKSQKKPQQPTKEHQFMINDEPMEGVKKNVLIKQLKGYDALRLEAAQFERSARKLELENAQLEHEALKKENEILDLQLEAAKMQVEALQNNKL